MEVGENTLGAVYEECNVEDLGMLDAEERECVEDGTSTAMGRLTGTDVKVEHPQSQGQSKSHRLKANKKKKKKKKRSSSGANSIDINRFVSDTCRRLREKKSYMVYTAVGCLGVSALNDLVKEVDAIQACGGQMTADGRRLRTGGGVLWNVIKAREPKAYREIMIKTKEFERIFNRQNVRQASGKLEGSDGGSQDFQRAPKEKMEGSDGICRDFARVSLGGSSDDCQLTVTAQLKDQHGEASAGREHASVHDRRRVPIFYDDDLLNNIVNSI